MVKAGPRTPELERELDFGSFFEAEYDRLLKMSYVLCRDRSEAEDLAQGAMARAFEGWDRVRAADSPTAYVYRIAVNLHRSAWRRTRAALRHPGPEPRIPDEPEAVAVRRQEILGALRSLPASQRRALLLVEWVGMSSEEAGRVLGVAPESVRGRVHRARRTLRARFGDDDA
jgi:RNA polymerase sigma-70 factor (ECF subfamily)